MPDRLPVETFDLPIAELRRAYRSAIYFSRSKRVLEAERPDAKAVMQVFQKNNAVLCGVDEAIAILRVATGHWENQRLAELLFDEFVDLRKQLRSTVLSDPMQYANVMRDLAYKQVELSRLWVSAWDDLEVMALHDGDDISPWETVMSIRGPLSQFVHLESVYLGVLARQTKIATNVRRVCQAANDKPILFFADRFDHYATQGGDGYAAKVGGARGVATDAMGAWWGEKGLGTMPHALIAAFDGDVVAATVAFEKHVPGVDLIGLVDFTNDCVGESLRLLDRLGDRLWGVRLDTSENMVDASITPAQMGDFKPTGVNAHLVCNVREALDAHGGQHVKIVASGGFNVEKITAFEEAGVPADSYAVGEAFLAGSNSYTADVVDPRVKAGRKRRPNERLQAVT